VEPMPRPSCNLKYSASVSWPFFIFLMRWYWVHLILRPPVGLLHQPRMIDDADCRAFSGMRIGRGNSSIRRKPAPLPLCPPQFLHNLTPAPTQAAMVGSWRLTAWAVARPSWLVTPILTWV
jgi:hypothetical protein